MAWCVVIAFFMMCLLPFISMSCQAAPPPRAEQNVAAERQPLKYSQSASAVNAYTRIHPWIDAGERLQVELLLDGKQRLKIDYQASRSGIAPESAANFQVPPGLEQVKLRGTLTTAAGKAIPFDRTWKVHDVGPYTRSLYQRDLPLTERIQTFANTLAALEKKSGNAFVNPVSMRKKERLEGGDAIARVEKIYQLKLPAAVQALSLYSISIGDAYFVKPSEIKTVLEVLRKDWSYPAQGENSPEKILSGSTLARYQRSLLFFVEVGDGMGALAWDPKGEQGGNWFWFHEETIDDPVLLRRPDGSPYSAEEALISPFQRFAVFGLIDYLFPGAEEATKPFELVVDSAHPYGLLQLHFNREEKKFRLLDGEKITPRLWLRSYDYHYAIF